MEKFSELINRINSAHSGLQEDKAALKAAINAKGGTLTDEKLSEYASAVAALSIGGDTGDTDLSVVTVTAADMLKGKVAVNAEGVAITGTIETVSASSDGEKVVVPAGFHAESKEFEIPDSTEIDLSFITAGASDILSGKVGADKDGNPVNGTIPAVSLQLSGNVVTIPEGYSPGETVTIPEMTITNDGNKITIPAGYNKTLQEFEITTLAGGADFYKCASVDIENKIWSGYKAVLSSGIYSFEENVTEGLKFNAIVPRISKVYTADALAVIEYLFSGYPAVSVTVPLAGDYTGSVNEDTVDVSSGANGTLTWGDKITGGGSVYALAFDGASYLDLPGVTTTALGGDFTLSLIVFLIDPTKRHGILSTASGSHIAIDAYNGKYNLWVGDGDYFQIQGDYDDGSDSYGGGSIPVKNAIGTHLAIVRKGTVWKLFVNGELSVQANADIAIQTGIDLRLGMFTPPYSEDKHYAVGRMRELIIYPEAMDDNLIGSLASGKSGYAGEGPYDVVDAGRILMSFNKDSKNYNFVKVYDGWAIAGNYEYVNADGMIMYAAMLVAKDKYSCMVSSWMNSAPVNIIGHVKSLTYVDGKEYFYHYQGTALYGVPSCDEGLPTLDAIAAEDAAKELLDRHYGRYAGHDLSDCNLYAYRAGVEGINGKWVKNTEFGDNQGTYVKGTYHIGIRDYGGYWYMYDITDPDTPLYAACSWDEEKGEYIPTEDITGPWIAMMGTQPPPRVLIGENGL